MIPYYDHGGIAIYNGDWRHITPPERPRLVLTDPPYGDGHDTDYTRFSGGQKRADGSDHPRHVYKEIANDTEPFDPAPLRSMAAESILFGANRYSDRLPCGSWLVWDKRSPGGSKGVMSDAEVAWWSRGRGIYIFEHAWDGFNRASERGSKLHPTQKPVALMRWCLVRAGLKRGDLVFDPYMGSGPVAEACRDMGLRYIGVELVESYCAAAVARLSQEVLDLGEVA